MSEAGGVPEALQAAAARFLAPSPQSPQAATSSPRVLLSWAQSLDGSIAAAPGIRTDLSGPESRRLTHFMRSISDGICVGVGTVLVDRPQLTTRDVVGPSPRPVVLDSRLRTPPDSLFIDPERKPLIFHTPLAAAMEARAEALANAGATLISVPPDPASGLSLPAVLHELSEAGMQSLMVEGGATVLAAFLRQRLAHAVCVTVSPRVLPGGVLIPFDAGGRQIGDPEQSGSWHVLGSDAVWLAQLLSAA